ncbi:MAG: hypothetical protein M1839_008786 [Geoglossum umbratile]|nr:MAG: hypothetical protein M1839_008786 [Geoglossum umbratile]
MARVKLSALRSTAARSSSGLKPRPYRVVYETITQKRKKKQSHATSFDREPPRGFTFVPAGNPKLTALCKEYSETEGCQIYAVTTSHRRARNISQHVCRIGYHFASSIVTRVCNDLGVCVTTSGHLIHLKNANESSASALGIKPTVDAKPNRRVGLHSEQTHIGQDSISQEQLNYEARNALTDLFPKIPEHDLSSIISRAFKKGGTKVGSARKLPLQHRVQLAALAHIRHQYTSYDSLLRTTPRYNARAQIEETCLRLIVQWRGDEGNDENDIEQILREVIVISDDDSDCNVDTGKNIQADREPSVEIVSSQLIAPEARGSQKTQGDPVGDGYIFGLGSVPSGSFENTNKKYPERKKNNRPSKTWSSRYRAFRDEYNKRGGRAEIRGQIFTAKTQHRNVKHGRDPLEGYSSSSLNRHADRPHPYMRLDSPRGPDPMKRLDNANLQDQVSGSSAWDRDDAIRKQIYREMTSSTAHPMGRSIAANMSDTETLRGRYDHSDTYGQLSQNYRQDVILTSIEDSLGKPIRHPNKNQQGHHSYGLVRYADQSAAKQIDARHSSRPENGLSLSDSQKAPSPPSRPQAIPNCVALGYGEQLQKRQRSYHEPIVISPRYDATENVRPSLVDHSRSDDMPKPPRPYVEQPRQQAPTQQNLQPYQLLRGSVPEYHLQELREPAGLSIHNSNIHYETHDRTLLRSSFQGGSCLAQLQPSDCEKARQQQPPPGGLNVPYSRDGYRPTFAGDDQNVATWGGYQRHLRLSNDSVYKPQDSRLERTSFNPYSELHGALSHESRHFVPRHYLKPVDDDHESHDQSFNFQPESKRPSSHEPPRLQPDASANSWNVSREDESTLIRPSPRLGKPPTNENLRGDIRAEQEIHQKQEARYSHNGSTFREANALGLRRSPQVYAPTAGLSGNAGDIRGVNREWTSKSDRYYRESVKPIYVETRPATPNSLKETIPDGMMLDKGPSQARKSLL